ncbi:hypothetical protein IHE44_0012727 [Lamprotornis superbus]|uniref:Rab-like protein 2B n=1 Tax=Lamprotornis superbus TaxID=245042 RepID=A0A835TS64_9PASS|nr:hypothetical protein IHE44_0012727 [Lamprotornis superbus]
MVHFRVSPAPRRVKSDVCERSWSISHGRALADYQWVRNQQCPAVFRVLDFWDTAGQERFRSMHASYYHQAHACIMVFDVQRKVTYKNLNSWYKELREFRPEIPCIVVANKIDADMKVTQKSFNFARKFSLPFYFVSAADGTNVVKLFNDAIRLAVAYKQHSGDFMDEVLRELESFDLPKTSKDLLDKGKSYTEEEPSSA